MSKSIAPISRREVLIGGAAAVAVAGFPLPAAIGQPILQAPPAPEKQTRGEIRMITRKRRFT